MLSLVFEGSVEFAPTPLRDHAGQAPTSFEIFLGQPPGSMAIAEGWRGIAARPRLRGKNYFPAKNTVPDFVPLGPTDLDLGTRINIERSVVIVMWTNLTRSDRGGETAGGLACCPDASLH